MTTAPAPPARAAVLTLAAAALCQLLLTGLDAKSTALLAGSLTVFSLSAVALDAVLLLGFGYAAFAVHRVRPAGTVLGLLCAGAALWRGLDALLDAAAALSSGNIQYWRTGQYGTTALLVLAALFAAIAVMSVSRRRTAQAR